MLRCKNCQKEAICGWERRDSKWTLRSVCCDALMIYSDGKAVDEPWVVGQKAKLRRREEEEPEDDDGLSLFESDEST